ncbi:MAG: hypothetical protein ACKPE1_05380, partial [Dolichospermum sp.]
YYEIQRGLLRSNATKKLAWFQQFCQDYPILFLDDLRIFAKASEIYADLTNKGKIIQDADILIAATAIIHNLILSPLTTILLWFRGVFVVGFFSTSCFSFTK